MQLGAPPAYSTRVYDGMSGVRVQVTQGGQILVIDPVTAILNLMTAVGLLAVASLVMSVFVESLCPMLQTALWKRGFNAMSSHINWAKVKRTAVKVIPSSQSNPETQKPKELAGRSGQ